MTGALLLAETIGVAIGGTGGFLAGERSEAGRAAARMSAYHDEAQKAIDDVRRKANRFAEMNLQATAENKALNEEFRKLQAGLPADLAGKNAELRRINLALSKQNEELAELIKARDQALDELRNERDRRHSPKKSGYDTKKT
jgi:hypothetical protein